MTVCMVTMRALRKRISRKPWNCGARVAAVPRRWRPSLGFGAPCCTTPIAPARPRRVADLEAENRRLRAENEKLLEQREILKKSLGIFSEPPPRGMPRSQP